MQSNGYRRLFWSFEYTLPGGVILVYFIDDLAQVQCLSCCTLRNIKKADWKQTRGKNTYLVKQELRKYVHLLIGTFRFLNCEELSILLSDLQLLLEYSFSSRV
jgi:hypothetical protein